MLNMQWQPGRPSLQRPSRPPMAAGRWPFPNIPSIDRLLSESVDEQIDQNSDLPCEMLPRWTDGEYADCGQRVSRHDWCQLSGNDIAFGYDIGQRCDANTGGDRFRNRNGAICLEPPLRVHRNRILPLAEFPAFGPYHDSLVPRDVVRGLGCAMLADVIRTGRDARKRLR